MSGGEQDAGFATALALSVSLAVALGATALVVRSEGDLRAARTALEKAQIDYRLDAIQQLAEQSLHAEPNAPEARDLSFDGLDATVQIQSEAAKIVPRNADALSDAWLAALRLTHPQDIKQRIKQAAASRPLTLQRLTDLDASPFWKRCAADAVSENADPKGAAALQASGILSRGLPKTLRLTTLASGGWVDDRIIRLTNDPADPVIILDRRIYRQTGPAIVCPTAPSGEAA